MTTDFDLFRSKRAFVEGAQKKIGRCGADRPARFRPGRDAPGG